MNWKTLLAYASGSVHELDLLRNEHLVTENHVPRPQIVARRISETKSARGVGGPKVLPKFSAGRVSLGGFYPRD